MDLATSNTKTRATQGSYWPLIDLLRSLAGALVSIGDPMKEKQTSTLLTIMWQSKGANLNLSHLIRTADKALRFFTPVCLY
jgi:nitric oxide synthase oxygenase domain/subunit